MFNTIFKLAAMGIILSLTASSSAATINTNSEPQTLGAVAPVETDARLAALETVLEGYNSPMIGEARTFIDVADRYNLDWRFLPAITGIESLYGNRIAPNTYNPFGWGGGYIEFDSWAQAIKTVGRELSERGKRAGISTPEEWAPRYCPPNWRNWSRGVRYFMNELEQEWLDTLVDQGATLTAAR